MRVADFQREHPGHCRNRPEGWNPVFEEDLKGSMFYYRSEYKAARAGKKCAEAIKATGCCQPEVVDDYIKNADAVSIYAATCTSIGTCPGHL